jgi:hypothetical protein
MRSNKQILARYLGATLLALLGVGCQQPAVRPTPSGEPKVSQTVPAQDDSAIDSAFFGLNNGTPLRTNLLVRGGSGQDGMPINFKDEIDESTLQAEDFVVIDSKGIEHTPLGAFLQPASEKGENRTVLLIGELGDDKSNRPVEVRVVGELRTLKKSDEASACSEERDLKGAFTKNVIPLAEGPSLFFAQVIKGSLAEKAPADHQVVQVAWQGGIVPVDKKLAEEELYRHYTVFVEANGELKALTPTSIADIEDGDNYHQLTVDSLDPVVKVFMPANIVQDPNGDANPETEIEVSYCPP